MKNVSEIAKELRSRGHKFGQLRLLKELGCHEPEVKHGRVLLYGDDMVSILDAKFTLEKPHYVMVQEPTESSVQAELVAIRKMLTDLCGAFEIPTVEA